MLGGAALARGKEGEGGVTRRALSPPRSPSTAACTLPSSGGRDLGAQDPVHKALATCSEMRPSVDISVGGEGSSVGVGAGKARTEFRSTVAA